MTGRADPGQALAVVGWLAAHHGHPWTEAAALARVAQVSPTPEGLSAALATAGLTTRLVHRKIGRIDPATLPVVLFDRAGGLLVLAALERGRARVVTPGGDRPEEELTPAALARRVTGEVLLVTPAAARTVPRRRVTGSGGPCGRTQAHGRRWRWPRSASTCWGSPCRSLS